MLVDTHCHLYSEYYENIDNIISKSCDAGVNFFINNGCNLITSKEVLELSNKYKNMYCTFGLHPSENLDEIDDIIKLIRENINNNKVVGIGEIGLDFSYTKENKVEQIRVFEIQLKYAEDNNLPVIIHSRDATEDMLKILKRYNLRGIIHCFNGSLEIAKEYIKLGYKLGINGVVTFKNCKLIDTIRKIGVENLVFETDSPYLSPVPYRGTKNDPSNIINIVKFLSNELNIKFEELEKVSNKNVSEIFDINLIS